MTSKSICVMVPEDMNLEMYIAHRHIGLTVCE
jgi:hypothetical protein